MHKLLIEDDEGKTVAVPLIRDEITIGRMEGNTIRLTEQNVSRKHARLTLRSGLLQIEDLGSYNGTSLNGSALSGSASLKDGDVILIGDYRLGIQEDKAAQVSGPSQTAADGSAPGVPTIEGTMDGQPTIPISTLVAQTAFAEPPGRLIVLSRFMSGTEFVLDRPSHVLGRTSENDIVINHKSISRHHAKIVREGGRYTMLDLESANGVRVRGVDRDRVDLQSGDIVELGEVRLRFVSGDGAVFDVQAPWWQNKRTIALSAAGGAVGLVLVLVLLLSRGPGKSPAPVVAALPPVAPVVQPTPPAPPPTPPPAAAAAEPEAPPTAPTPSVSLDELLASAKRNAQAEQWDEAFALVAKAVAQAPDSAEAATLRQSIEAEKKNGERFAALKESFANNDFAAVLQGSGDIPDDSMFHARTVDLRKSARSQFIAAHLEAAKGKLADGNCDEAKSEAELVLGEDAKNKKATGIVKRCDAMAAQPEPAAPEPAAKTPPVVAAAKPTPRRASAPVARVAAPKTKAAADPPKPEPAAPAADPEKLIRDAQQAWFRGQYAAAIDSARKALRARPGMTNAYQIIAVCSCALHDADAATRAYEKLDERNKVYVKTACQKSGISF
jgi:pSer/pThr/pTyr-binding forkhead associated (FHA) protein/tetratricopeptide (TPR) repeat protein